MTLTAAAPLERIPVHAGAATVLHAWPVSQHAGERSADRLNLHVYPGDGTSWPYEDDGHSLV